MSFRGNGRDYIDTRYENDSVQYRTDSSYYDADYECSDVGTQQGYESVSEVGTHQGYESYNEGGTRQEDEYEIDDLEARHDGRISFPQASRQVSFSTRSFNYSDGLATGRRNNNEEYSDFNEDDNIKVSDNGPSDTGPSDTGPSDTGPSDTNPSDNSRSKLAADNANWKFKKYTNSQESFQSFSDSLSKKAKKKGLRVLIPRGISNEDFIDPSKIRSLSNLVCKSWGNDVDVDDLETRLLDFYFAQNLRHEKYGDSTPLGVMALYAHLSGIRADVAWAEDCEAKRKNNERRISWDEWEKNEKKKLKNKPTFTVATIAVSSIMFIGCIDASGWRFEPFTVNPMIGPSVETLIEMGAKLTYNIVVEGEWWRLFTSMFLHAGLIHYIFNMSTLWIVGRSLEQNFGMYCVAILFLLPDAFGTVLSSIFLPRYPSVGASAGIFGLIGACISDIACNWPVLFSSKVNVDDNSYRHHAKVIIFLLLEIFLNVLIGFVPMIDNFSHLGGLTVGFLCGLTLGTRVKVTFFGEETSFGRRIWITFLNYFGLIASVFMLFVALIVLYSLDGEAHGCKKCLFVSCIPFPPWKDDEEKWWTCDTYY